MVKLLSALKSSGIASPMRYSTYLKLRTWCAKLVTPKPPDPPFKHITQIGDPTLRAPSEPIPRESIATPEIQFLIKQMNDVFDEYGCVGLSAVQIGIPLRLFLMEVKKSHLKAYGEAEIKNQEMCLIPRTLVINPEVKVTDYAKAVFPESCLSVRGFYGNVQRYRGVRLTGFDGEGEELIIEAEGWTARIIQHEMDHLNGRLYTDVMDRKSFACSCWQVVNERNGKVLLPFGPE